MKLTNKEFDLRIKKQPESIEWYDGQIEHSFSQQDKGKVDYNGLSDGEKLCLYVYAWNKNYIAPGKSGILKQFEWTNYRLQKVIKFLEGLIYVRACFSESTGLIAGRGYYFLGSENFI